MAVMPSPRLPIHLAPAAGLPLRPTHELPPCLPDRGCCAQDQKWTSSLSATNNLRYSGNVLFQGFNGVASNALQLQVGPPLALGRG